MAKKTRRSSLVSNTLRRKGKKPNADAMPQRDLLQTNRLNVSKIKRRYVVVALIGIFILSFFLNSSALEWGQTGDVSWSPDAIDGRITAIYLPYMYKQWAHKYPRGQFFVSSFFYNPKIQQWEKEPVTIQMPDGRIARTPLNQKRLYELATISRKLSLFMSMRILLAVFLTARKLFDDGLAGLLSCLVLALSCHFVFYGKSACVDIPAFFWFAWAACFGLYAIKTDRLIYYLAAGFCASWSVCTKEGVATFHIGLAAALAVLLIHAEMKAGKPFKKAILSLLNWKIIAGVVLAALLFITMQNMWNSLDEWRYRSQFWKGVIEGEFRSQGVRFIGLLERTYRGLYSGWGGPFIVVLLPISLCYWLFKYRWQFCLMIYPLLSFFFLTVLVIGQNLPRFMMCAYAGIAIIMGKTLADWYRYKKIPAAVRGFLPLIILVPSFICCVCFNAEMKNDTRKRAEQWMRDNAKSQAIVGLSMTRQYAPRVWLDDFSSIPEWDSKGIATLQGKIVVWPDYIIGSNQWPCMSQNDADFFGSMFRDETNYEKQAEFSRIYFHQRNFIWKYCLRFFELHPWISPRMLIYKKTTPQD